MRLLLVLTCLGALSAAAGGPRGGAPAARSFASAPVAQRPVVAPSVGRRQAGLVNPGHPYLRPRFAVAAYPYYVPAYGPYALQVAPLAEEAPPAPQAPTEAVATGNPVPQEARPESMGSVELRNDAPQPEVFHWVDDEGVDNYSTSVPDEMRERAKVVDAKLSGIVWNAGPVEVKPTKP